MATRFAGQGDTIRDSGVDKWINIFGDVQVLKNMKRLRTAAQRQAMRKAIGKGLVPIAKLARGLAREKTGMLKRSIKSKVTKMVSGKVFVDPKVFAIKNSMTGGEFKRVKIAGPARGMKYTDIMANFRKHGGKTEVIKPANYAHLLEFGTKNMPPQPFMRPAMHIGRTVALDMIARELRKELKKLGLE